MALSAFRRALLYLALFFVAFLLHVVSFSVTAWEAVDAAQCSAVQRGLWRECDCDGCHFWKTGTTPRYVVAVQSVMCVCLVASLMGLACYAAWISQHKDQKLMALTCIMVISAGVFSLVAVVVYGVGSAGVEGGRLGWAFYVAVVSSVVYSSSAVVLVLDRCLLTSLVHSLADVPAHATLGRRSSEDASKYFAKMDKLAAAAAEDTTQHSNRGYLGSDSSHSLPAHTRPPPAMSTGDIVTVSGGIHNGHHTDPPPAYDGVSQPYAAGSAQLV